MNERWRTIIEQVHASGRRVVLAVTGGGSGAIAKLLQVPGGSRTLLEAVVPYDVRALADFLGAEPVHACSVDTAVAMARRARDRAETLTDAGAPLLGVGTTASLVSDRPKKGQHRCHIATASDTATQVLSIVLEKGIRDRTQEEEVVASAIICCVAEACGIEAPEISTLLEANDQFTRNSVESIDWISRLLSGSVDRVTVLPDGQVMSTAVIPGGVLAGSFDPLHQGHIGLFHVAAELLNAPISFEISVINVDKPSLDSVTLRRRLQQFAWWANVELTRAPTFGEKALLLPGTTFVIGADTAQRVVSPKYYGGSESIMLGALQQVASRGCAFLVAARADAAGQVQSLADLDIPPGLRGLFTQVPQSRFRLDVSSSAIRAHVQKQKL